MRIDALEHAGAVGLSMREGHVALQDRPVHLGLSRRQMPQDVPAGQRGLVGRLVGRRVVKRFVVGLCVGFLVVGRLVGCLVGRLVTVCAQNTHKTSRTQAAISPQLTCKWHWLGH